MKRTLSATMTLREFENGYWYREQLKDFAERIGIPAAAKLRKDELEKAMILKCLDHHQGNISRVAEALGLSRAALYRRFEKYGIQS